MKYIILLTSLLSVTSESIAVEISEVIGVIPGEISRIEGVNIGAPFEILRIPTPNSKLSKIYPDLEVMISAESKRIVGVSAKRAFQSKTECHNSQTTVRNTLSKAFSSKYTGRDPRWQYQPPDASITAGALCSIAKPYPVLRLDITHTQTNDEILRHFK